MEEIIRLLEKILAELREISAKLGNATVFIGVDDDRPAPEGEETP